MVHRSGRSGDRWATEICWSLGQKKNRFTVITGQDQAGKNAALYVGRPGVSPSCARSGPGQGISPPGPQCPSTSVSQQTFSIKGQIVKMSGLWAT